MVGRADGVAIAAAERSRGPAGGQRHLALHVHAHSPISKALCFVFEPGDEEPTAVVKMIPERRFAHRLQREIERLDSIRAVVAHAPVVAAALPPAPLYTGDIDGDYVAVEKADSLAAAARDDDRAATMSWLRSFQVAAERRRLPWGEADETTLFRDIEDGWKRAGPARTAEVIGRVQRLLATLRGAPVPRSAVHGDFWPGNIARKGDEVRIFDWEWAELEGLPSFDLWTYDLGELRMQALRGTGIDALTRSLAVGLSRVEEEMAARSIPAQLALATLPGVIARLALRIRSVTGLEDEMEIPSRHVMAAVENVLGCGS
jgi:hypothetical protein